MSRYLSARTGNYYHAPEDKFLKVFESQDGGRRTFSVIVASAYHAGIVGPEDNGIVVLDEDNRIVVLDQHLRQASGYFGPSPDQLSEAKRLLGLPWGQFVTFCRSNPRYRSRSIPDALSPEPQFRYPPSAQENRLLIRDDLLKSDANAGVTYPARRRMEIISALADHHFHCWRHEPHRMAWNIKINSTFDDDGRHPDFQTDPAFDERWQEHIRTDRELFWTACRDALSLYTDGHYATHPGDDAGQYGFAVQGRSGGHLVLTRFRSYEEPELRWENQMEFKEWASKLDDADLVGLYRLVRHLDHDIERRHQELAYQYAFQRSLKEEEWREEADQDSLLSTVSPR